jgi:hypothetical protein
MGVITFAGWYSPALCRAHPDKIFVFGDNTKGFGKGGQAIIRDEPNAFGVPTKRLPSMAEGSFFEEGNAADLNFVFDALSNLWSMLRGDADRQPLTIVIPVNAQGKVSLGLERAELPQRAPSIYATIETHVSEMCDAYGVEHVADEDSFPN